jgi:hypothetical protein
VQFGDVRKYISARAKQLCLDLTTGRAGAGAKPPSPSGGGALFLFQLVVFLRALASPHPLQNLHPQWPLAASHSASWRSCEQLIPRRTRLLASLSLDRSTAR